MDTGTAKGTGLTIAERGYFMVCSCCGRKKRLLDMFYSSGTGANKVQFCSDCWEVVEKMESDRQGGEGELYALHLHQLQKRAKSPSPEFEGWLKTHFPEEEAAW